MMKIVKSNERHLVNTESLQSYWLFSYSDYLDIKNTHFGDLKVFNDETLLAGKSFSPQSVENKEIITIILEGELTHEDSTGTKDVLKAGDVQVMSAGEGISFSGINLTGKDTRLCRMWINPLRQDMAPTSNKKSFDVISRKNELIHVAGQGYSDALKIRANVTVSISKMEKGQMFDLLTDIARYVFIYVIEGELDVCGHKLETYDQARINQNEPLVIKAESDSFFILVDATGNY